MARWRVSTRQDSVAGRKMCLLSANQNEAWPRAVSGKSDPPTELSREGQSMHSGLLWRHLYLTTVTDYRHRTQPFFRYVYIQIPISIIVK